MNSYQVAEEDAIQWTQYLAVISGTLAMLTSGMHYGWTSPSLPKMEEESSYLHVTSDEGAWIASILMAGAFSACPFTAFLLNMFGRKTILLATCFPFLISWIIIIFAMSATTLYLARFIGGFAMGMAFAAMPLYIGEIAESHIRGTLGSAIPVMYNLGVFVSYGIGPYVSIPIFATIATSIPILLFFTFIWFPKSPYYLLSKNRTDEAKMSLQKFRGQGPAINLEFELISKSVEEQTANNANVLELFIVKSNRKALFIMLAVRFFHQLCGMQSFVFYAEKMFEEAGGVLSSSTSALLYALLQLVSSFMSTILLDRVGRRILLIVSCLGSAVCLAVVGFCFYRQDHGLLPNVNLEWLTMAAALVYVVVSSVGLGVVPYVLVGELFPTHVKGLATCICIMYYDLISIIVAKLYQLAADYLGTYVPFWIFMSSCVVAAVFVVMCVPETKGKRLDEIQAMLKGKQTEEKNNTYV